jgi:DNA-binding response OmpR family regulator
MGHRILLIDDDVELVGLLRDYLVREGFVVTVAHDGASGLEIANSAAPDLIVLDVTMPELNGLVVLARLRAASAVPVLILTARGDDIDRVTGLELGADDYVSKPVTSRELVARIRAILKRAAGMAASINGAQAINAGKLTLWPARRRAVLAGRTLELTSTEFNLLEVLLRNAGRLVSKAELSQQALGRPLTRFDRSIDVHMSSIRQKLGTLADGRSLIQTVVRKGYQLIVD